MHSEFRPQEIGLLFGQEHLWELLTQWVNDTKTIPQSILISGAYGCGKTSIARILSQALGASGNDLYEINAAEARGIDDVRSWMDATRFAAFGPAKVFIIDELHQMTAAAQSALLKVIEEPPQGVYFILCTTEPYKLLPTIKSRCTSIEVKPLGREALADLVRFLSKGKISEENIEAIYRHSRGHARDAVKLVQVALAQGLLSPAAIQAVVGISIEEAAALIEKLLDPNRPATAAREFRSLLEVGDERSVIGVLDDMVDQAMLQGNARVLPKYYQCLLVRAAKREHKVLAREQLLHAIGTFCDERSGG